MTTWKRRTTVFLAIVFAVLLMSGLIEKAYSQQAAKPIKLTYALFMPATSAISKKNTEYAQEIEKRTNGRVQIQIFQSGSLLGAPAMYQGIRNGIADMGNGITSYSPGNFPFTMIVELPSAAESGWAVSNAYYDFMQKYEPKEWNDVHPLTVCGPSFGVMLVGTGKTPIHKLEDLKGKSIRTNFAEITTALGATVKDVPMTEVYDSISKGVLDGVQTNSEPLKSWKLGDVTKYITLFFGPVMPSNVIYNIMNKNKWNSLPPDIQKVITDVSREYSGKLGLTWDEQLVQGLEYAKSVGDTIYVLPKEEAARWTAAIMPFVDTRLKSLTAKGFTQKEVDDAWDYFKSRVAYWNGQQAKNNVVPVQAQMEAVLKK
jgi:TRAP-type C4-dicarboxylate transport system substrate-binding protein